MKKFCILFVVVFGLLSLTGCDKKEIGEGVNQDVSGNALVKQAVTDPAQLTEMYGEIVHKGKLAPKVVIQGVRMSEDMAGVNIIVPDKTDPMIISLICDQRMGTWGVSHSLTANGHPPMAATELSIMNYRAGITDIREADETKPVFSTSNGDTNIATGLKRIEKLDPNSTVAIVLDRQGQDGYYEGEAWSYLLPVDQVVEGLKSVNLSVCTKSPLEDDQSPEIIYTSIDDIRKAAQKNKTL